MNDQIEAYVTEVTSKLTCSKEQKRDVADEMRDHLYSAMTTYLEEDVVENQQQAALRAIEAFGETNLIQENFQQVVDPVYGIVKKLAWVGFIVYSCVVLWLLLISRVIERIQNYYFNTSDFVFNRYVSLPDDTETFFDFTLWQSNIDWVPFNTITTYFTNFNHYNSSIIFENVLGNMLILFPLGLLLPFLSKKLRTFKSIVYVAIATSIMIELVQFILQIGVADIDDIILNTLGTMLGYLIYLVIMKLLSLRFKKSQHSRQIV